MGRTFTIELTDEQATMLAQIAAQEGRSPQSVVDSAFWHGLHMLASSADPATYPDDMKGDLPF